MLICIRKPYHQQLRSALTPWENKVKCLDSKRCLSDYSCYRSVFVSLFNLLVNGSLFYSSPFLFINILGKYSGAVTYFVTFVVVTMTHPKRGRDGLYLTSIWSASNYSTESHIINKKVRTFKSTNETTVWSFCLLMMCHLCSVTVFCSCLLKVTMTNSTSCWRRSSRRWPPLR